MRSKADLDKLCNNIADRTEAVVRASMERIRGSDRGDALDAELEARSAEALAISRDILHRKRN
jgi:hypothetical protein